MRQAGGSILIVTLWTLAVLFLLAVGLAYRAGLELHMARYEKGRLELYSVAKGGVALARAVLLEDASGEAVDTLQDAWSQDPSRFKEQELGGGVFSIRHRIREDGEETFRYGMTDEESKIPLNAADTDILRRIPDMEEAHVQSIRAWRGDADLPPEVVAREDDYYAARERPYSRKGAPFESLEELLLVRGMTPERVAKIAPYLTVYGTGKVNLNTTDDTVLSFLGLAEDLSRRFVEARRGEDGVAGTEDDFVFEALSDMVSPEWMERLGADQDEQLALTNFLTARQALLSVASQAFRIEIEARLNASRMRKEIVSVVDRSKPGVFQYWHEK